MSPTCAATLRPLDSPAGGVTAGSPRCVSSGGRGFVLCAFWRAKSSALRLLAGAATGRLEAIHLRFALGTESAVGGFSVLLFAGTVVERAVRIDPDRDARVTAKMN